MKGVVFSARDGWIGEFQLSALLLLLILLTSFLVLLLLVAGELAVLRLMGKSVVPVVLAPVVSLSVLLESSFSSGGSLSFPCCHLKLTLSLALVLVSVGVGSWFLAWWLLALQQKGFGLL